MKKLLIVFTAFTFLMTACNNNKTAGKETETETKTEKDKEETREDDKKSSNNDDDDNSSSRSGWSAREVNDFVSSCVGEAEKGMTRTAAERYCECMQERLEKKYPNPADAASVNLESEEMQQMVKDCLF